jgi:NAD(P)-dependent dehydrogenase (short-subunit alcohol dehydrogenase family)
MNWHSGQRELTPAPSFSQGEAHESSRKHGTGDGGEPRPRRGSGARPRRARSQGGARRSRRSGTRRRRGGNPPKRGTAIVLPGDIGDKDAIHGIAAAAAAVAGPVDLLVHNASILGRTPLRLLLDTDCEDLSRVLEVNLVGPFRLTKVIAGSMALRRSGLVLHVTSDASVNAYPSWGAYSVSKAALDHLGRVLAAELAGLGVKVLGVDPGEMRTRMHAEAMPEADPATLADPEEIAGRIVSMVEHADSLETGSRLEAPTWRPG